MHLCKEWQTLLEARHNWVALLLGALKPSKGSRSQFPHHWCLGKLGVLECQVLFWPEEGFGCSLVLGELGKCQIEFAWTLQVRRRLVRRWSFGGEKQCLAVLTGEKTKACYGGADGGFKANSFGCFSLFLLNLNLSAAALMPLPLLCQDMLRAFG